jgi:hypothetical protein
MTSGIRKVQQKAIPFVHSAPGVSETVVKSARIRASDVQTAKKYRKI